MHQASISAPSRLTSLVTVAAAATETVHGREARKPRTGAPPARCIDARLWKAPCFVNDCIARLRSKVVELTVQQFRSSAGCYIGAASYFSCVV